MKWVCTSSCARTNTTTATGSTGSTLVSLFTKGRFTLQLTDAAAVWKPSISILRAAQSISTLFQSPHRTFTSL